MKLISIQPAKDGIHKYTALFRVNDNEHKTVHFGAYGMMDHTLYYKKSPELAEKRKELYLKRHRVNENWNDPTTPASLSRWVLWNKPTVEASIRDFKDRFYL